MGTGSRIAAWSVAIALLLAGGSALAGGILLSPALLDQIKIGVTTEKEVEQILGPPRNRSHFPRLNLTSMDYDMQGDMGKNRVDVGVMIGSEGIVRDVQKVPRYSGG